MSDPQQVIDRKAKLAKLQELGVDPYGCRFTDVRPIRDVRNEAEALNLEPGQQAEQLKVRVAGRIMLHRPTGKLVFMTLRDGTGDLQVAVSKAAVNETEFQVAAKLVNLGDIVGAEGIIGKTKTGELTVWVSSFTMLSKASGLQKNLKKMETD